jgi:hypothetical protein
MLNYDIAAPREFDRERGLAEVDGQPPNVEGDAPDPIRTSRSSDRVLNAELEGLSALGSSLPPNLINCALQYRAEDHGQTDGYEYSIDRPPSRVQQIPKYFMHCALHSKLPVRKVEDSRERNA